MSLILRLKAIHKDKHYFAVLLTVSIHFLLLVLLQNKSLPISKYSAEVKAKEAIVFLAITTPVEVPKPKQKPFLEAKHKVFQATNLATVPVLNQTQKNTALPTPSLPTEAQHELATQAAPSAPTANEWAFAARYTLHNSKAYRYNWGQQIRSMMGTAVEGADQGVVRFRVEIAPNGTLSKLETLWSTSAVAEQLARKAIEKLPALPPTPTGQPLIFEKTISFSPFATDGPPIYKDDCLPQAPAFKNPFVWDGQSEPQVKAAKPIEKLDPKALEECLKQLPQDTIEAESAHDQRLFEQWGWNKKSK